MATSRGWPKNHFGENQLSPGSLGMSPLPTAHPRLLQQTSVRPSTRSYPRFSLAMGSSPGFGSTARDSPRPLQTRFRSGSGCPSLSLATNGHSPVHSPIGTPSEGSTPPSDRLEAHGFRLSFTPLTGVLFTCPSRYSSAIGRAGYLALGGGPPCFPRDSTCPAVLTVTERSQPPVAYRALTVFGRPFQQRSARGPVAHSVAGLPPRPSGRPTPDQHRRQPVPPAGFGLLPVRSPLLRE